MVGVVVGVIVVLVIVILAVAGNKTKNNENAAGKTCAGYNYPDKQKLDHCAGPGGNVQDFGLTVTAAAITRQTSNPILGPEICSAVTYANRSNTTKNYNEFDWKLQSPSGNVQSFEITGASLDSGQIVSGGNKSGTVCFKDNGEHGQFVLIWKPDAFRSDRGTWIQTLP